MNWPWEFGLLMIHTYRATNYAAKHYRRKYQKDDQAL